MSPVPEEVDCRACGLCCLGWEHEEPFVSLEPEDIQALKKRGLPVLQGWHGNHLPYQMDVVQEGPFKGGEVCRCIHLKGSPGLSVTCTIYEDRPPACRRAIQPGTPLCRETREMWFAEVTA